MQIECTKCTKITDLTKQSIRRNKRNNNDQFICHICKTSDPNYKTKVAEMLVARNKSNKHRESMSKKVKEHWASEYGDKQRESMQSNEYKQTMSESCKEAWKDESYCKMKSEQSTQLWQNEQYRTKVTNSCTEKWNDQEYRDRVINNMDHDKISKHSKEMWANHEYKQRMVEIIRARWQDQAFIDKWVSIVNSDEHKNKCAVARQNSLTSMTIPHKVVCGILDDLNIIYRVEEPIGPYNFDIFLPNHNLLIEVNGDYWHSLTKGVVRDRQKSSYVANNLPNYKLKYIWEHQTKSSEFVLSNIKQWLGIDKIDKIQFNIADVLIKHIDNKVAHIFLSKYHYTLSVGKGAIAYGAFIGDNLIAVCCFSSLTRNESAVRLG